MLFDNNFPVCVKGSGLRCEQFLMSEKMKCLWTYLKDEMMHGIFVNAPANSFIVKV